jgi:YHS domain-containing protein
MKLALLLCLFFVHAQAGKTANLDDGIILKGYDPVSYFTSAHPQKGDPKINVVDEGVKYLFANEANKTEFLKNKAKYTPAYQGWCATAVAKGYKYDIDPENFKVTDGKLYLFYKGWKGDAKKDWVKDEPAYIKKAEANWPKVRESKE